MQSADQRVGTCIYVYMYITERGFLSEIIHKESRIHDISYRNTGMAMQLFKLVRYGH